MRDQTYKPLTPETLGARLGHIAAIRERLGDPDGWSSREVGDGNLNLVFILDGANGSVIVKQALPHLRLVGESWPLPLKRSFFEYHALTRQQRRDPGSVPEIFHFDELQALIVMEYLTPHVILRHSLMEGRRHDGLSKMLGQFCARTLFGGSDLAMVTADRKADLALFAGNVELCDITENLVFSDPYFEAEMNRNTPGLDGIAARLRADVELKVAAQHLKFIYAANAETMLHGDLHTGSVMVTDEDSKVIDPEFVSYGPMGFDIGMLIANFLMGYFAQPGHEASAGERDAYGEWILGVADDIWDVFRAEFEQLWRTERTGMLYQASLFEDRGHVAGAEQALAERLDAVWRDMLGFCGVEIHRRILGLAHIAEFEQIADETLRARCEARALMLGRKLVVDRGRIGRMGEVLDLARGMKDGEYL